MVRFYSPSGALLCVALASSLASIIVPSAALPIRLNAGGTAFQDSVTGFFWESDSTYLPSGGGRYSVSTDISNSDIDMRVYQSERYFPVWTDKTGTYEIPVEPGLKYGVVLHFAEIYFQTSGARVFEVWVENELVFPIIDIVERAGSNLKALVLHVESPVVTDGFLTVELVGSKNNPKLSGLEVVDLAEFTPPTAPPTPAEQVSPPPTAPPTLEEQVSLLPIRINAGGPPYEDQFTGYFWESDAAYLPGAGGITIVSESISGTDLDMRVYQSERFFAPWAGGKGHFEIPVEPGKAYGVVLHFCEIHFNAVNKRVFQVYIQNEEAFPLVDIVARAGGSKSALVLHAQSPNVTDGILTIDLVGLVQNPKISGLEILDLEDFHPPNATETEKPFEILINCGGGIHVEENGLRVWQADTEYFQGGYVFTSMADIAGTREPQIYRTERYGEFTYEIPVEEGEYEVILHFAEVFFDQVGKRVFNIKVEDEFIMNVDIVEKGAGNFKAMTLESVVIVSDGYLSLDFFDAVPKVNNPKVSAISVKQLGPHLAHAVADGPYTVVDTDDDGYGIVHVDGTPSHTHGFGLKLIDWKWTEGPLTIGEGESPALRLPVGDHFVVLTVEDDGGNIHSEGAAVHVLEYGFPAITSISPRSGDIAGGEWVSLKGSGFDYTNEEIVVRFGMSELTGNDITIVNSTTIMVQAPPAVIGVPVSLGVVTPKAESNNDLHYTYISGMPIEFESGHLADFEVPTCATFGPDGNLYVGTMEGALAKITLTDGFTKIENAVVSVVAQDRSILGITFDPLDTSINPTAYVATSKLFHGESDNSSGKGVNGNVLMVSGASLDIVKELITGLPVSDHDHGVNAIEFGDHGEIYLQIGSNTNLGLPGALTGKQIQKESYYSAATVVAYVSDPLFDGTITYDAPIDGAPNGGHGIEVFASGFRNPYGITLHSNGNIYGTDNGPNFGYGDRSTGCGENDYMPDVETMDKLNLIRQGGYYGHPNRLRAAVDNDERQCAWRDPTLPSDDEFTAPILNVPSSTNGIIEWTTDHFGGQLRQNLITSKYTAGLHRIILTADGENVIPQSQKPLFLVGDDTLDLTQAPDGTLIDVRFPTSSLYFHKPVEIASDELAVKSVFPRRGALAGGSILEIYGEKLDKNGNPTVKVGGSDCPSTFVSASKLKCTLPGGTGTVDVVVSSGPDSYTFERGYRFVTGHRA